MTAVRRRRTLSLAAIAALALAAAAVGYRTGRLQELWRWPAAGEAIPFHEVVVADVAGDCKMVGDVDGDGALDLVIGGSPGEGLVWFSFDGRRKTTIAQPATEFTTDGALGDVDGDGDLDVVVPDGEVGENLLWFANPRPGDGPWRRHVVGALGGWGKDVELADFDGDGNLDVAARSPATLRIFFQVHRGSFAERVLAGAHIGAEGLASGDVDGDGDVDLVVSGEWLEDPGGEKARFAAAWRAHRIGAAPDEFKALVTDLDGDRRADVLFSASEQIADVTWWRPATADPRGGWTSRTLVSSLRGCHTLQAADIDCDGDLDVVVAQMHTTRQREIAVLVNHDGRGGAWRKVAWGSSGLHNGVVADVDGDGDPDLMGANWTGNPPLRLWINRVDPKTPRLDAWVYQQASASHELTFGLAFGDVDADGRMDIASGRFWYRNTPEGSFVRSAPLPGRLQAVLAVDVDGGRAELLAQQTEGSDLQLVLVGLAEGKAPRTRLVGSVPKASHDEGAQGHALAQVFAGGKDEVLLSSGGGVYCFAIPGDPWTEAWPRLRIHANPSDEGFAAGDVDRDGDLDLVAGTGESKRVEWYENPGVARGDWPAHVIGEVAEFVFPDRFAVADLDGDGRLDVVGTEENGRDSGASTLWWSQPDDPRGPWPRRHLATQGSTNSMSVADLDGDGDVDVATAEHRGERRLTLFLNDGRGHFREQVVDRGKESHLGARSVDLDGDGDLDLVSIGFDEPAFVHLWKNPLRRR